MVAVITRNVASKTETQNIVLEGEIIKVTDCYVDKKGNGLPARPTNQIVEVLLDDDLNARNLIIKVSVGKENWKVLYLKNRRVKILID